MGREMPGRRSQLRLTVDVRRLPAGAVVAPTGELDHHSAELLRESLDACLSEGCARIVIDCSGLDFCDSTGLNVLLAVRVDAEAAGGAVHLAAMPPAVARVFEITGAHAVFVVHDSLDHAVAAVASD